MEECNGLIGKWIIEDDGMSKIKEHNDKEKEDHKVKWSRNIDNETSVYI